MIADDRQLDQAVQQLARMYRALANLRREMASADRSQFAILAEGPLDEIHRQRLEIEAYTGQNTAKELQSDVWLQIQGPTLAWPEAPTSVVTALLDAFRKGVQAVAEFLTTGHLTTRPTAELKRACDLRVVAFETGSLCVGIRLPDEAQPDFQGTPAPPVRRALVEYLQVASWVASEAPPSQLETFEPMHRRVLLNALRPFLPRPRGLVEYVELRGREVPGGCPIRLTKKASPRVDSAIDRLVAETVESHQGDLREIDLDNLSFILRNAEDIQEIRCSFDEDLLETAKEALDRAVRVSGVRRLEQGRRLSPVLRVTRLEIVEPATSETN